MRRSPTPTPSTTYWLTPILAIEMLATASPAGGREGGGGLVVLVVVVLVVLDGGTVVEEPATELDGVDDDGVDVDVDAAARWSVCWNWSRRSSWARAW